MRPLIRFFVKQPVLVNVVYVGVILFGLMFLGNIAVDRYPNLRLGESIVTTYYPGASAEDVERLVTHDIEDAIRGMEDIEFVRSTSRMGQSVIIVKWIDDTDYLSLHNELRRRVLAIQNQLPTINGKVLTPGFQKSEADEWAPVVQINLMAEGLGGEKRPLVLLAKELRNEIEALPQVLEVILLGDDAQQFTLALNPERLSEYGVDIHTVLHALRDSGQSLPGGRIVTALGERQIRIDDRHRDPEDILSVIIRRDGDGSFITLRELIDVPHSGIERTATGLRSHLNGFNSSIGLKIRKDPQGNAVSVRDEAVAVTKAFVERHSDKQVSYTISLDSTVQIGDSMRILSHSFITACVLVMLTLFVFLGPQQSRLRRLGILAGLGCTAAVSFIPSTGISLVIMLVYAVFVAVMCRSASLTVSGIIFSFIGALILLYIGGYSVNEITLLGLVLTIGIIVDDAIVVLENIQRHRELGKNITEAAIEGASEVFWPVVSATTTTIAAFLPMLMMTGAVGDFFALIPIAVSAALFASLVEALFILPLHVVDMERVFGPEKHHTQEDEQYASNSITDRLHRLYERMLGWLLNHPFIAVGGVFVLFVCSVAILNLSNPATAKDLGIRPPLLLKFFPEDKSGLWISLQMPSGTSLHETEEVSQDIAQHLRTRGSDVISNVTTLVGMKMSSSYKPIWGDQFAFLEAELPPLHIRSKFNPDHLVEDLRTDLAETFQMSGAEMAITYRQSGPPASPPVALRVQGVDETNVFAMAEELFAYMKEETREGGELDGVIDLTHDAIITNDIFAFRPDNEAMSRHDIQTATVQEFLSTVFEGSWIGDYRRSDDEIPIRVRIDEAHVSSLPTVMNLAVQDDPMTGKIRFSDVGTMELTNEPARLERRDYLRMVGITGNIKSGTPFSQERLQQVVEPWVEEHGHKYPGASVRYGGDADSTSRSYQTMLQAFLISAIIIYGVLAVQFRSYAQPLLIMSNIVFSFIGVILVMAAFSALIAYLPDGWIRTERTWFTLHSFIAIIGLSGLVVNDAIVFIDFINRHRAEGLPLREALMKAGHQRMRPILMTTITTLAGLLPMAIGLPNFSEAWSPFATCFVAGLSISTAMTLLIIPVLYELLDKIVLRTRGLVMRKNHAVLPVENK